jgi:hypothetical protein
MFSSHAVALGMVILFNPFTPALVIAYLHFLAFCIFCICDIRKLNIPTKIVRVTMDCLNLTLMVIGTAGIRYAQYCFGDICCKDLIF